MATPLPPTLPRTVDLAAWMEKKSHFLLGPRLTGKSFLVKHALPDARVYDLLDDDVFRALSHDPKRLGQELESDDQVVVIDEVQRLPALLNEVHRLVESRRIRFLLTGSSARKLNRAGVNLLGGRARVKHLHPLTREELGKHFDLRRALRSGLLAAIYFSDDPRADLDTYVGTYLQQEIAAEAVTRNIPAFSRFLHTAAQCNATMVNFTKISNDAQVPRTTVHEYFDILKDTLIAHEVPAWKQSRKRKPVSTSKLYFFDVGVASALQGRLVEPRTPEFGSAFETWILHELICHRDYRGGDPVSYWRSTSGFEVDFVLGDHTGIEVKASEHVAPQDLRSLRALGEEKKMKRLVCVSMESRRREVDGVRVLPYAAFLEELAAGEFGG